mmetsp:Transcript_47643/g.101947  ORF Transcript_47643/g.101947 Transcript_47643/m.101947 type:complete len:275 (-) Transcript_47643:117-941(-)
MSDKFSSASQLQLPLGSWQDGATVATERCLTCRKLASSKHSVSFFATAPSVSFGSVEERLTVCAKALSPGGVDMGHFSTAPLAWPSNEEARLERRCSTGAVVAATATTSLSGFSSMGLRLHVCDGNVCGDRDRCSAPWFCSKSTERKSKSTDFERRRISLTPLAQSLAQPLSRPPPGDCAQPRPPAGIRRFGSFVSTNAVSSCPSPVPWITFFGCKCHGSERSGSAGSCACLNGRDCWHFSRSVSTTTSGVASGLRCEALASASCAVSPSVAGA